MLIENYKNAINKCNRCGFCFDLTGLGKYRMCPVNDVKGFQSYSAKGKLILAAALMDGKLKLSEDVAKHIFACCDCGACEQNCFFSLELGNIFDALKADTVQQGIVLKDHALMVERVQESSNIFGQPHEKRFQYLRKKQKKAETVYFVGCTTSLARTRIARANYDIMERASLDFTLLENEKCCGFPLLSAGQTELAKTFATRDVEEIEKVGAKRVIFSCPGCYRMFKKEYPRLVGRLPFEAVHTTELYEELLDREKLPLRKQLSSTVTYHDPCHLGRHMGVYESPRKILEHIQGLRVNEMTRNREHAYCCGAGGGNLPQAFPEVSTEIAVRRTLEAAETGAQTLVSSCPACSSNFMLAKRRLKSNMEVKDLAEIIIETLK